MARFQCNACGGSFDDVLEDGTEYYHACPPETLVRVQRAGAWRRVPLADVRGTDTVTVLRAGARVETLVSAVLPDDRREDDTVRARPNSRDENVDRRKHRDRTKPHTRDDVLKAAGGGVIPVVVP